ncbi:DUF4199 domain-containing protein [Novosphingobium sp. MW5]|nr:DUF4199 domain-containing protein [Novosphingobium sp. MW5]
MTRIIITFGAIAGTIELVLLALTMGFVADHGSLGMVLGYLSMLIALSLVFAGVKKYRDEQLGGVIGFGKAFAMGLGIAGIAALFYVIGWEAYLWSTDYTFVEVFSAKALADMQAQGASAEAMAKARADMADFAAIYANPVMRMAVTLTEIAPVALLVPLISALLLRRPGFVPARVR